MNESAQPILSGRGDVSRAIFSLLHELRPRFLADPAELYVRETRRLRGGPEVGAFPNPDQEEFAQAEVEQLANGRISHRFLEMIEARRRAKFEAWPSAMKGFLDAVARLRKESPGSAPRYRAFEQLETVYLQDLPKFIAAMRELELQPGEAELIASSIDAFPAIRGTLYFWWNANFICLADRRIPAVDKVDDWRHCVEASYCEVFVSGDQQLLRSVPRLQRHLKPLSVQDLLR